MLKPYHGDNDDPSRGESQRAPTAVVASFDRDIEAIEAKRVIRRRFEDGGDRLRGEAPSIENFCEGAENNAEPVGSDERTEVAAIDTVAKS